jgi:multiple sugar transport system permease protein
MSTGGAEMQKQSIWKIIRYIILIILLVWTLGPIIWMLITSFKSHITALTPSLSFNLDDIVKNYSNVLFLRFGGYWRLLLNSALAGTISTLIALGIGIPAAYGFSRFNFRGKSNIAFYILSQRMIPPIAFVYPIYLTIVRLGMIDTLPGLLIPYVFMLLPFIIWMMIGFFDTIPTEIEEAYIVDGHSRFQAFLRVIMPLTLPGIIASALFSVILSWNEFLIALFVISSGMKTAPIAAAGLVSAEKGIEWNTAATVGVLTILPVLVFAIFVQKYLARGLTLGAVK